MRRRFESSRGRQGFLELHFALPGCGLIYTWAQPRYRAGKETGLAFESLPEAARTAIGEFVTSSLTQSL